MTIKSLLQKHGLVGFATYTGISCISYPSWVAAIYLGVDVNEFLTQVKTWTGFEQQDMDHKSVEMKSKEDSQSDPSIAVIDNGFWHQVGTTLLLATAGHKLIFPIRLALTGVLTPRVSRFLLKRNIDLNELWKKWRQSRSLLKK
jgi:hypothetical protein